MSENSSNTGTGGANNSDDTKPLRIPVDARDTRTNPPTRAAKNKFSLLAWLNRVAGIVALIGVGSLWFATQSALNQMEATLNGPLGMKNVDITFNPFGFIGVIWDFVSSNLVAVVIVGLVLYIAYDKRNAIIAKLRNGQSE